LGAHAGTLPRSFKIDNKSKNKYIPKLSNTYHGEWKKELKTLKCALLAYFLVTFKDVFCCTYPFKNI
jgi:hypothetical protein